MSWATGGLVKSSPLVDGGIDSTLEVPTRGLFSWVPGLMIEQMFDHRDYGIGLLPGEGPDELAAEDRLAYEVACLEMADGWVAPDRHVLPADFESMTPGPFLAAIVGSVDRSKLNGHDLVRLLEAEARLEASVTAGKLSSVAEIAHCPPGNSDSPVERSSDEVEYAEAEIAAALTLTRRSAKSLTERALWFDGSGRRVRDAMKSGSVSGAKADVFQRALGHLDDDTVGSVLDSTLGTASHLTTGQLSYRVSRYVMTEDPDGAKSSFQEGLKDRKLVAHSNPDFTGCLHLCSCHPSDIAAANSYVDGIARRLKTEGEDRSLDELRNDVAMSLLQGIEPARNRPGAGGERSGKTHLTVPLLTLAELADMPGELAGYAPIIADIARQIALRQVDGKWTWSVTNDGEVIATGTTSYRPRAAQKRKARADYPTCVHPGCRMPAIECDLDHRDPHGRGGRTHNENLAPLCRYHHMIRHHTPWEYVRLPDGDHRWTSPLGHTYVRRRAPPEAA